MHMTDIDKGMARYMHNPDCPDSLWMTNKVNKARYSRYIIGPTGHLLYNRAAGQTMEESDIKEPFKRKRKLLI